MNGLMSITSLVVLVFCAVLRPQHATCPVGMDLRTGVQSDGSFACWPHPVGNPDLDGTWRPELGHAVPDVSVQRSWVIVGQVYCTGNTRPVIENWRSVGCR